jgi:hypothetical protein
MSALRSLRNDLSSSEYCLALRIRSGQFCDAKAVFCVLIVWGVEEREREGLRCAFSGLEHLGDILICGCKLGRALSGPSREKHEPHADVANGVLRNVGQYKFDSPEGAGVW